MATLRNKRKLAAVSKETPENARNSQSENTLDPEMAQRCYSKVSEEIEGRVNRKLSTEFSRTQTRILGALSKFDEFLLNLQIRSCSVAVPATSRHSDSKNWEPTGDRFIGDPCPEAVCSTYHSSNLNDSEQEETHHIVTGIPEKNRKCHHMVTGIRKEIPYCSLSNSTRKKR